MSKKSFTVRVELRPRQYKSGLTYANNAKKEVRLRKAEVAAIKKATEIWSSQKVSAQISRLVSKNLNEFEIENPPVIKRDPVKRGLDTAQWTARTFTHGTPNYGNTIEIQLVNKQKPYPYTIFVDNSNGIKLYRGVIANMAAVRLAPKKLIWLRNKKGKLYWRYPRIRPHHPMDMDRLTKEPEWQITGLYKNDPTRNYYKVLRFHKKGMTLFRPRARYMRDTDWYRNHIIEETTEAAKKVIMILGK